MFRRSGEERDVEDEDEDGLRITSGDDEDDNGENSPLFAEGQRCDVCSDEDGRVGIDETCRGAYPGNPVLTGYNCLEGALRDAYARMEGVAAIVEPFGENGAHYYYRVDEMPAYEFVRSDIEAVSWLLLSIGDDCARCGEQSHVAWMTQEVVDPRLPENEPVFRSLEADVEHLCTRCAATVVAASYRALGLPLMTVEVPRSAMGIIMPTSD